MGLPQEEQDIVALVHVFVDRDVRPGGYGYSTEFDAERYFRDAPLMIVGEGTNEIQRNVIVSQLIERGGL